MTREEIHFGSKVFAFKVMAKKYRQMTVISNSLKVKIDEKSRIIKDTKKYVSVNQKAEKEARNAKVRAEIEELETRKRQIDLLLEWVNKQIWKLPPELRYYCFSLSVLGTTINSLKDSKVKDNHRVSAKIKQKLEGVISEEDLEVLERSINEDLSDEDFDALFA